MSEVAAKSPANPANVKPMKVTSPALHPHTSRPGSVRPVLKGSTHAIATTADSAAPGTATAQSTTATAHSAPVDVRTAQASSVCHVGLGKANPKSGSAASLKTPPVYLKFDNRSRAVSGQLTVNVMEKKQHMFGIGGSLAFFTNFITEHPNANLIYDAIFSELRPSVLRLRNSYDQPNQYLTAEQILDNDRKLVEAAYARLGDNKPQILMSSWTPPVALKKNGKLTGGGPDAVLKKDASGQFIYKKFAQYWLDSLKEYGRLGIVPRWISIQNEPGKLPARFFIIALQFMRELLNLTFSVLICNQLCFSYRVDVSLPFLLLRLQHRCS